MTYICGQCGGTVLADLNHQSKMVTVEPCRGCLKLAKNDGVIAGMEKAYEIQNQVFDNVLGSTCNG